MYLNGVQTGSINTGNTSATQLTDGIIKLGTDYWSDSANLRYQGDIFYAAIHDRALSALEVKQNFNALRGRFGI
jgi:hypothetical protein